MADDPVAEVEKDKPQPAKPNLDLRTLYSGKVLVFLMGVVAFSLVTLLIVQATGGAQKLRLLVEGAGMWAPLAFVLVKASTYVIAPLSGTPVQLAGGALFGLWGGMMLTVIGDTLGGTINYWIARSVGRKGVTKFAGKKALKQVDELADRVGGWRLLLVARLMLSSLYDFISYAAGLARLPYNQFVLVTAIGGIPSSLLAAYLGKTAVASETGMYVFVGICGVFLVVGGILHLTQRRKKAEAEPE